MKSEEREFGRDVPIRLDMAVRIAFPDGSIGVKALRRERDAGRLTTEIVANKEFTTLAAIERMRELCRVRPKAPASSGEPKAGRPTDHYEAAPDGLSKTAGEGIQLAAIEALVAGLKSN